MAKHKNPPQRLDPKRARQLIARIKKQIAQIEKVCSGTLTTRMKVCGKPECRCATDPDARHGPYYEWTRREGKRLLHSVVSAAEADDLETAIANYRKVRQLMKEWEAHSVELIRSAHPQSPRRNQH